MASQAALKQYDEYSESSATSPAAEMSEERRARIARISEAASRLPVNKCGPDLEDGGFNDGRQIKRDFA